MKIGVSFSQMLLENTQCLDERIKNSHNPYLNEFNLVYKNFNSRLSVFEAMTSQQTEVIEQEGVDISS